MQCFNCSFENMPGSAGCAKCGASLTLATATIDVHPPRAHAWQKSLPRAWWSIRRGVYHANQWFDALMARWGVDADAVRIDHSAAFRAVVPGWAQAYSGRGMAARTYFGAYLALLLPGLVLMGTNLGSALLGFAFSVHVAAAVDALQTQFRSLRDRLVYVAATAAALGLLVYLPAGWLATRVATPVRIVGYSMPPVQMGDVVWYNRMATLAAGDIVLHQIYEGRFNARLDNGPNAVVDLAGQRISRVVAVGGQTVAWRDNQLWVDDELCRWQPAMGQYFGQSSSRLVPEGYIFVLPDNLAINALGLALTLRDPVDWFGMCNVPRAWVLGKVYFRSYPPARVGFPD